MAIYLDTTQNEHKLLIEAVENSSIDSWLKKSLISRIQSDINEKLARSACEHNFGSYIGKKECCKKCGGIDIGMGESWTLENKEDNEDSSTAS